ncbi:putative armadillo-like helical, symplekin, symplekin/Pta1 [Helianthus annuus]|uniref:Armadillo-like helical, symplekin, symplekin/Pta1 n=1 Tax=Helianthus annuus TaxID=4232 RepID=A0A9K3DXU4_HELAN|nr:symplekin [Helianthus annuus]KAF5762617.1 putative armadillo-like helical, symplekin, symplekin/Pta1 [Helianthus annuus]KAJ0471350.1 putative armadillo-like helical, symplekin, symplekin/Pta1 [Helianthus annuus]
MVGMISMEKFSGLIHSAKFSSDVPSKLDNLRKLKDLDPHLLSHLFPQLLDLHTDRSSPVRRFLAEIAGDVGLNNTDLFPDIVPLLLTLLRDATPAVARQAITCGITLFRRSLIKTAIQGLYSSDLHDSLQSSWLWMLKLKDEIYSMAYQPHSDGRQLLALKFVEAVTLLYTADPSASTEPPEDHTSRDEFNIAWLRGGHPILNVADLSVEASKNLGLLLDQLRYPAVKSLSNMVVIVLIKSLSEIAKKRPAFYGRILPVLLGLDPSTSAVKAGHVSGVHHALKNAFLTCLKCMHPGAVPWRDRLVGSLREMKAGDLAEEALQQVLRGNSSTTQDIKPSIESCDAVHSSAVRKRPEVQDVNKDDDVPGKRVKPNEELKGKSSSKQNVESGPVQQLISMFSSLVAQGEQSAAMLEILISSISADLLAQVVMANMPNLPPVRPIEEAENTESYPATAGGANLSAYLTDILSKSTKPQVTHSDFETHNDEEPEMEGEQPATKDSDDVADSTTNQGLVPSVPPVFLNIPPSIPIAGLGTPSEDIDIGELEDGIPGLESSAKNDGMPEITKMDMSPVDLEDNSRDQITKMDIVPSVSMSTDRSEELSPKAETNSNNSSTLTSLQLTSKVVLPKMSAPVVNLTDEQKDHIQKSAFIRIIEAYKHIAVAGGSELRFSLLSYLGVEFPLELDPWRFLQTHILSDYTNHEGHELTLRVLYRLFGEAEADHDFFSSTTATSVYEMFLLKVAEALRDSFPPSDKSLSRLLNEVPYLPKSVVKLLEWLCVPGNSEEVHSGDRVHQGLSIVWSLILHRPPTRDACLKIALQSAVHHLEEVQTKAIRLVANKLYPMPSISQQIEDFAKDMLLSAMNADTSVDDGSNTELAMDTQMEKPMTESVSANTKDGSSEGTSENIPSSSVTDAQRCMSLYFALCTKKHSLFRQLLVVYKNMSKAAKQAISVQIPKLVRTIGSSSQLLEIIADPPAGSENLLMQVVQTLTDGAIPSPELIATIKKLYDTKLKDAEILIPVLPFLPKDEVLQMFSCFVNLPLDKFQAALARTLQESSEGGAGLTPAEVLIAIHGIDPDKDGIPLKKVTDACNTCFQQRQIFTQQVLAKVLNQLVEQIPLPMLFMRTVIQTIGAFPALVDFIMEILSRLVSKQIWKNQKLWVGFLKCAQLTKPQSFTVLLQLPPAQLEIALNKQPVLKAPLASYASQPDIRTSLPRSILAVLGIQQDSQTESQGQTTQSQAQSQTVSQAQSHTQSQAQSHTQSQAQSHTQSPAQSHTQSQAQSHTQSQAQSQTQSQAQSQTQSQAQSQTVDTGNSGKDVAAEEPKESSSS